MRSVGYLCFVDIIVIFYSYLAFLNGNVFLGSLHLHLLVGKVKRNVVID